MIIERGSQKYYQDALQVVRNFYQEALKEYDAKFDEKVILSSFDKYKNDSFLLIINDRCEGVLAGQGISAPLNNDKVYQEVIWYVNEPYRKYGIKLLQEAQRILKAEGYSSLIMVCLYNSKTEKLFKLYQEMGFTLFESHFLKRL